jgi:hypothetical protein
MFREAVLRHKLFVELARKATSKKRVAGTGLDCDCGLWRELVRQSAQGLLHLSYGRTLIRILMPATASQLQKRIAKMKVRLSMIQKCKPMVVAFWSIWQIWTGMKIFTPRSLTQRMATPPLPRLNLFLSNSSGVCTDSCQWQCLPTKKND